MSAIQSLRTATDALSRCPVLVVGGLLYGLVVLPQRALQLAGVPLAPALIQVVTFFVTPFVVASVVGMAREALDGETSLGSGTAVGKARYVDLLLATLLELGIKLAFGVVFVILALLLLVGVGSAGPAALVGGGVLLLALLAYVAVLFLVQFYPVVVVVEDAGPVDAVTESVGFVRSNLVSTLGFSVVTVLLGGLASLPVAGVAAYQFATTDPGSAGDAPGPIGGGMTPGGGAANGSGGTPQLADALASGAGPGLGLSTPEVVALSLVSVAATAAFVAFRLTYATAFYRRNGRSVEERVLDDEW
ncbi:hypothetical protein [Haloplanus halophilus]|uniref:DUF7847 domain-containing protein n=1 Tax=Haloplanus halophilus TaxID=2949993 RepID=UPI00203AF806|nr:hypothetical protein [Haloplanus sp. GDY1]